MIELGPAAAAGLHVPVPCGLGSAVETPLVVSLRSCFVGKEFFTGASALEPAGAGLRLEVRDGSLALEADNGFSREREHATCKGRYRFGGILLAFCTGECLDLAHAGEALPLGFSILLLQLCPRKGLADLGHTARGAFQLRAGRELALVATGACMAGRREVGAHAVPLLGGEAVELTDLLALLASCLGPASIVVGVPVDLFSSKRLQQQRRALGSAASKEPVREAPEEQHVLPAADATYSHGPQRGVRALADAEVQEHGLQRLPLAGVGGHGKGGHQRDLGAADLERRLGPLPVQEPRTAHGLDRVQSGLAGAIQLPGGSFELHEDRSGLLIVLVPNPRVDVADATAQEGLLGSVQVLRQGDWHADGERQHAAKVACVSVVVLEPSDLGSFVARLRLQDQADGPITSHGQAQRHAGIPAICSSPVLVDLGVGIIVGHDCGGLPELGLLQPWVIGPRDEPAARRALLRRKRAAFDRVSVKVPVVGFGEAPLAELIDDLVPPVVLAALPLDELGDLAWVRSTGDSGRVRPTDLPCSLRPCLGGWQARWQESRRREEEADGSRPTTRR